MSKGTTKGNGRSPLAEAAAALDGELRRYMELADAARRVPLNSQKNLERAGKAVAEAASAQERVAEHVRTLVMAIQTAREEQQKSAEALQEHVQKIAARSLELAGLLEQFSALGEKAQLLNGRLQSLSSFKRDPYSGGQGEKSELDVQLESVFADMESVAGAADTLAKDAESKELTDVARQAESLRQQVFAAKNKLQLLQKGGATTSE